MINNIASPSQAQNQANQTIQSTLATAALQEQGGKREGAESKNPSEAVNGSVAIDEVRTAFEELNTQLESQRISVDFNVDEDTGRIVVKVRDFDSGKTLRQIPNESALEFARNANKGIGITVDTVM
tara:strand:- start:159 stop:536 length:378 start_codon:yes stop_codon:yes gene_type:complete